MTTTRVEIDQFKREFPFRCELAVDFPHLSQFKALREVGSGRKFAVRVGYTKYETRTALSAQRKEVGASVQFRGKEGETVLSDL